MTNKANLPKRKFRILARRRGQPALIPSWLFVVLWEGDPAPYPSRMGYLLWGRVHWVWLPYWRTCLLVPGLTFRPEPRFHWLWFRINWIKRYKRFDAAG